MQKFANKVIEAYSKSQDDDWVDQQMNNRSHPIVQMTDYLKMKINPYATAVEDINEPRSQPLWVNLENTIKGAPYSLEGNTTSEDIVYRAESFRLFWSDSNVLFLRASTGLLHGLFGDDNSTKCGSRLV